MAAREDSSDYLTQEFEAMDMDRDGLMTPQEVFGILIHQGVELSENEERKVNHPFTLSQFKDFMGGLKSSNRNLRKIFENFESFIRDGKRVAKKENILNCLKEWGHDNAEEMVARMDINDGYITYKSYVQVSYQAKSENF